MQIRFQNRPTFLFKALPVSDNILTRIIFWPGIIILWPAGQYIIIIFDPPYNILTRPHEKMEIKESKCKTYYY